MGIGDSEIPRSPVETSELDRDALPQYGFGSDVGFEQLIDSNPFLFRLHTPKETSPFYDNTEPFFVGQAFNDGVNDAAFCASNVSPYRPPSTYKYADVAKHMEWTTRASSPFVSASFSFAWAIWEATRRYHHGMKHSIQIAVIDAKALSGKAVTAVELLRQGPSQEYVHFRRRIRSLFTDLCDQPSQGPLEVVSIRIRVSRCPRLGVHTWHGRTRIDPPHADPPTSTLVFSRPGSLPREGHADQPRGMGV